MDLLPNGHTVSSRRGTNASFIVLLSLFRGIRRLVVVIQAGLALHEATFFANRTAALESNRAWMAADATGHGPRAAHDVADIVVAAAAVDDACTGDRSGGVLGAGGCGCEMGDVFGHGVTRADACDAYVGGFAGFAEGVVAGVEVFAFLELSVKTLPSSCYTRVRCSYLELIL
jgi:hypothetical protein